ncbi:MAG: DUF4397 domain-containing protein [Bdellovibrionales bacterium]|nr:DUF4397 domain-containing protein [Bdellovibrionales bacterium]
MKIVRLAALALCVLASACGGGGGGGGGGDGQSLVRSKSTAIRVIHAGIDATPVSVVVGEGEERQVVQTARYAQPRFYSSIPSGSLDLRVERANTPGSVVKSFAGQFADQTEYTVALYGELEGSGLRVALVEDTTVRPEPGMSLVNVFNGYIENGISVSVGSVTFPDLKFGSFGGFKDVASGEAQVEVLRSDGVLLGSFLIELPSAGEATIAVVGSRDLGVRFFPVYKDLD